MLENSTRVGFLWVTKIATWVGIHRGSQESAKGLYQENILLPLLMRIFPEGAQGWRKTALQISQSNSSITLHFQVMLYSSLHSSLNQPSHTQSFRMP